MPLRISLRAATRCLLLLMPVLLMPALARADLYVIVNKANAIESINTDQLERVYMMKARRFENGVTAEPVSHAEGSKPRETFNKKVLGRTEQQLRYYWSRRMFAGGERPPPSAVNDAEIESFVASREGGIGYLTVAPKDERVKTVMVVKD